MMAVSGLAWITQIAKSIFTAPEPENAVSEYIELENQKQAEDSTHVIPYIGWFDAEEYRREMEQDPTVQAEREREVAKKKTVELRIKIPHTSLYDFYNLDPTDKMSYYDSSSRSLPKYRRAPSLDLHTDRGYVQDSASQVPCSPRLVQRNDNQQRVVTRMLQSYPQQDGSFVCPIRQPGPMRAPPGDNQVDSQGQQTTESDDIPPPLPVKRRDLMRPDDPRYPKVTVNVPYKRNYSTSDLFNNDRSTSTRHPHQRSVPHQQSGPNEPYFNPRQAISRALSQPNHLGAVNVNDQNHHKITNVSAEIHHNTAQLTNSTLIISTQNAVPLHALVSTQQNSTQQNSTQRGVSTQHRHTSQREQGLRSINSTHSSQRDLHNQPGGLSRSFNGSSNSTPFYSSHSSTSIPPQAYYPRNGGVRRSNSQHSSSSSSTYTGGSADYNHTSRRETGYQGRRKMSDSMSSSVEVVGEEECDNTGPELYPEQRLDLPLKMRPRSQVRMTCFEMLHNSHLVLEFLSHKVDILEQSLQLLTDKLPDMSDLAVTTPPCTKIDTEFCICHDIFDMSKLGHGIWKYFCDADKCNFCSQLFEQLANRPMRSCQLSVLDLNLTFLQSEALIVTGVDNNSLVVFIQASNAVWSNCDEDCLLDLSNFLEYISATVRNGLISVIVDSRVSPEPITQLIMDSLHNAQRNTKGGIAEASFIVDRPSHTPRRLLKPLSKTSVFEIDFCSLSDCVLKLSPDRLPVQLGGQYQFDPDSWIRSHACLEKKVQQHRRAFGDIFNSTHQLSLVPRTIRHAGNVIHQHKNSVDVIERTTRALDRSKFTEDGSPYPNDVNDIDACNILRDAEVRQLLDDLSTFMTGTDVIRQIMDSLQSFGQSGRQVIRLKQLAEERLNKLYGCQKLWFCIEEITKTLTLLRKAHDIINKHRTISNNLKSAQVQYNNFNKIKQSVSKLIIQGNELLAESRSVLAQVNAPIPWLDQLSSKLQSELSYLQSFLDKTELLVTDTHQCYTTLDQAYDWAVESMKFVSSMNMDDCLTEGGVERLSTSLTSFVKEHKIIDKRVFDDVSVKARNLGNKKLMEQCRIARSRCEETKQVLKVRETTIVRAREEIEAQRAKKISMVQLAAETNITPITSPARCVRTPSQDDDDIWLPQLPKSASSESQDSSIKYKVSHSSKPDDTNNNVTRKSLSSKSHSQSSLSKSQGAQPSTAGLLPNNQTRNISESMDTMASSQEDMLSTGSQSLTEDTDKQLHTVSPILSDHQIENSMVKRRSFAGFTATNDSQNSFPSNNLSKHSSSTKRTTVEDSIKRLSDSPSTDVSEQDEGITPGDDNSSTHSHSELSKSVVEKLEALNIMDPSCQQQDSKKGGLSKSHGKDHHSFRDSVITGSSGSLASLQEEHETMTEDSGVLTKSTSSSNSQDSGNGQHQASTDSSNNQWSPVPVNSHLLKQKVSHQWQSMADLRLTESEIRSRRTLAHIMDELIHTEQDYVMALKLVVDKYIPEMSREDLPQTLRGNRGLIFGNIEKIYDFHNHYFLKKLKECEKEPFRMSQCFLEHEKEFMMYALYNKNKPKSDQLMIEHASSFFRSLQMELGDKMDLSSYLLKPVQRMGKYALILKQILKECPESSAEYQDLSAAQDMIKFCLQHGNDLLAMDSLKECDVNLQEQGTLLLQDEFMVQKTRGKAAKRHIFLFDDLLVFAKSKRMNSGCDEYIYKTSLKTADLGLTENVGGSGNKFEIWFRKRSRENWTLQASTPQIKNKWVLTFEKILWNQAIKNRESRLTELSSMGIGSKPSLDLKASEDNINDRTINTEITHKAIQRRSTPESGGSEPSSPFSRKSSKNSSLRSRSSSSPRPKISGPTSSVHSGSSTENSSQAITISRIDVTAPVTSALHMTRSTGVLASPKTNTTTTPSHSQSQSQMMTRSDSGVSTLSNHSILSPQTAPGASPARDNKSTAAAFLSLLDQPHGPPESKV